MHIPFSYQQRQGNKLTGGKPKKLVIHSTANTSPAINERNNLARPENKRYASFHDVVDDVEVIECIPHDEIAFHAGACNRTSVSLEICEGGSRSITMSNAVKHASSVLKRHGLTTKDMIRHYDCTGKNCPSIMSKNNWLEWYTFKSLVAIDMKGGANMTEQEVIEIVKDVIEPSRVKGGSPNAHWAYRAYAFLKDKGVNIKERRFDDRITRGEVVQILAMMEGMKDE